MRTEPSFSNDPDDHVLGAANNSGAGSGAHFDEGQLLSDYRQRYGLSIDPFVDDPHFPFYPGAQRRQILEQLLHLCQFSQNLLIVAGDYGVGKTRMAQALIDALDDADDICFVEGQITSDIDSILIEILAQFELTARDDLVEFCKKKTEQDGLVVIIVDNAHHLTDEVVLALANLLQENIASRLHLVLFAEPYLLDRVESINAPDVVLTDFFLEKFSLAESVDYLNFRMEMADYLGPEVFLEAKVEPWWRQSQGQLLLLHEHAQEKLLATVSTSRSGGYGAHKRGLPVVHVVVVSVLIGGLFLGYLYLGDDSSGKQVVQSSQQISVPVQQAAESSSTKSVSLRSDSSSSIGGGLSVGVMEKGIDARHSSASSASNSLSSAEKSQSAAVVKQSVVPLAQTNELRTESLQKPPKLSSSSSIGKAIKKSDASSSASSKNVSKIKAENFEFAAGFTDQERTILAWNASEYTLQLVGLSNEKAAHEYISMQPNRKDLLLFKSLRQGKDWFVVVTGHYPTSSKARQAIEGLPESQKKASPWPREIKVVHKEIEKK